MLCFFLFFFFSGWQSLIPFLSIKNTWGLVRCQARTKSVLYGLRPEFFQVLGRGILLADSRIKWFLSDVHMHFESVRLTSRIALRKCTWTSHQNNSMRVFAGKMPGPDTLAHTLCEPAQSTCTRTGGLWQSRSFGGIEWRSQ